MFAADDAALATALDAGRAVVWACTALRAAVHPDAFNAVTAASSAAFAVDSITYATTVAIVLAASADASDITAAYIAHAAILFTADSALAGRSSEMVYDTGSMICLIYSLPSLPVG